MTKKACETKESKKNWENLRQGTMSRPWEASDPPQFFFYDINFGIGVSEWKQRKKNDSCRAQKVIKFYISIDISTAVEFLFHISLKKLLFWWHSGILFSISFPIFKLKVSLLFLFFLKFYTCVHPIANLVCTCDALTWDNVRSNSEFGKIQFLETSSGTMSNASFLTHISWSIECTARQCQWNFAIGYW